MFDKFYVISESCEICASEYIKEESDKLKGLPDDQKKTDKIHKIIHAAFKASYKPCVRYPCREQSYDNFAFHNICVEHLYKMIDAIKEQEEDNNELS